MKLTCFKNIIRLLLCLSVAALFSSCGAKKSQAYYDYKTQYIATERDGSYTVRSWGRGRNAVDALEEARKQAIYDVLFTGLQPSSSLNLSPVKPLLLEVNAKDKYADYFNAFFQDNGAYLEFCSVKERKWMTSKWTRAEGQSLCETTVCVFASKLKAKLQQDGILKTNE